MKLTGKHIGQFFILIAGLIILAHAVIPHHHHFEYFQTNQENLDCENIDPEHNNESHDSHCHAFNTIILEKTNFVSVASKITLNNFFNFYIADTNKTSAIKSDVAKIYNLDFYLQKQLLLCNHSLRSPPATV